MARVYDGDVLANGRETPDILDMFEDAEAQRQRDEMLARFASESLALSCDERVPPSALGYVQQILSTTSTRRVRVDAIMQLSRHIPIEHSIYASGSDGVQCVGRATVSDRFVREHC